MLSRAIRVMVVDDSKVARLLLSHIFTQAGMTVVAALENATEAMRVLEHDVPDVIVMDVEMPGMDGLEATRTIMETRPMPIIIASSVLSREDAEHTFRCLEAGALALVEKPVGPAHPNFARIERAIVRTVRAMADVKVVRRWRSQRNNRSGKVSLQSEVRGRDIRVVAIGASTGGPSSIRAVLEGLAPDFPLPILIVQHMSEGFIAGFAQWLTSVTRLPVAVARDGERVERGGVWMAPDGAHLELSADMRIRLSGAPSENSARPSVCHLFRSVASACGANAAGVLLTGMGVDGASGLKELRDAGALTIAEHESTSIVYGMPHAAVELGAVELLLTPPKIAQTLSSLTKTRT